MTARTINKWVMLLLADAIICRAEAQQIAPAAYRANAPVNYVRVWDALSPQTIPDTLVAKGFKDVRQTTQYFDGLGRLLQTVIKKGSLITGDTARDFVTPVVYDLFSREQFKYLPFAANNTGGNSSICDGLFKLNPFQQDSSFNKSIFSDESWYYGQTVFEASPLNTVQKVMSAGNSWAGSSRGVETKYWLNTTTDSVRIWTVSAVANNFGTYSTSSMYSAGTLFKNITFDEANNQVIEFKDKEGKVILKKVQLTAAADTGLGKGHYSWLCTYYIYDKLDQLRAVVQPKGVELLITNSWSFTTDILNEQSFRYEYDQRQRMIMKKVPGSGTVYMIYDTRDRLVMTQDSIMRAAHQWLYTGYDGLNRPIATGLMTDNTYYNNAAYHRSHADTSISYPASGVYTIDTLTKTFYDDYTWREGQGNPLSSTRSTSEDGYLQTVSNTTWPYPQNATEQTNQLKGMVTGTKVKVLGSTTYLYSVSFYDEKGRVVQVQAQNITTGTDIISTQYSWTGQPLLTITKNVKSGTYSQTSIALTQMTYDSLGRVTKIEKKVSNTKVNSGNMPSSWKTIVQNEYDALGQLKKKRLGSTPLDSLYYEYNIRGWMLGMNRNYVKDTASTVNWFGFDLGYDQTSFTVNGSSKSYVSAQYNGNIEGMLWKSTGDDQLRKYDFTYDAANRFTGADFNQLTSNSFSKAAGIDFSVSGLNYDANGNILNMNQKGWVLGGSNTIDSLLYTYITNSNKLLNVLDRKNDTATRLGDFRSSTAYMTSLSNNKTSSATDYLYDANGNLTIDKNKDINSILYNYLNLPDSIRITGKGTIKYTYDASGNKLKKVTRDSTVSPVKVTTTLYLFGNYVNDTLQFVAQEEGRIRYRVKDSSLVYDYFIKDHLGNVRMVLTEEEQTDAYPAASLETNQLSTERSFYARVDSGRVNKSTVSGYPNDTYTNPNDYIQQTSGSGVKIGTSIVLKVMAGDKFSFRVSEWYKKNGVTPGTPVNPLTDILAALTSGVGGISPAVHGETLSQLQSTGALNAGATSFYNSHSTSDSTTKPKAFINWVLFDEQFKYVAGNSGFEQVGADNPSSVTVHQQTNKPIDKNGYLYIYVSNETPNINVFFDNLQVTHIRGPLLEETHYYPFGLSMAGISSKALSFGNPPNKMKYNNMELQTGEFSDGMGLEMYEYKYRFYDHQIGRFISQDKLANKYVYYSPYQFAGNEVPNAIDLDGLEPYVPNYQLEIELARKSKGGEQAYLDRKLKEGIGTLKVLKVAAIFTVAIVQPEIGIPLMVSDLSGVPVTPSPAALEGVAASEISTIERNAAQGAAFEQKVVTNLASEGHTNIAQQVTIKAGNGVKTKLDVVSNDPSGKLALTEAKSSSTAPLTKNQNLAFPSIAQDGGVVVGKGKPGVPGGTVIPPTQVNIVRPIADATYVKPGIFIPVLPPKQKN